MTRDDQKVQWFLQRYFGGLTDRSAMVGPRLVAVYRRDWQLEQAWGFFVDKKLLGPDDPYCTGSFQVSTGGAIELRLMVDGTPLTPDDVLYVLRRATQDNQDEVRLCLDARVFIDDRFCGVFKDWQ